jgi:hypothetical protein
LLLALAGCVPAARGADPPAKAPRYPFNEVAKAVGIDFRHHNGCTGAANIVETTGTGCAVLDYDNDGWLDVYLMEGKHAPGQTNRLYHNLGNGHFEDVTERSGLQGHTYGVACAVGDYDGDGFVDLLELNWPKNYLYHNNGDGTFTDVTRKAGGLGTGFSAGGCIADLDGDGLPDIYVARYCRFDSSSKPLCYHEGTPSSCPPYYYPAEPDLFFHNNGDGTFKECAAAHGFVDRNGRGLGAIPVDYNQDGRLDLFVTNDGTANFLFRNDGGGKFTEVAGKEGIALSETGAALGNMGADFADIRGNGQLACVIGVFQNEISPLFEYEPGFGFHDDSRAAGLVRLTQGVLTFGMGFADLNNDGLPDIFAVNGHVIDHAEQIEKVPTAQTRQFFINTGNGKFRDGTAEGGPAITTPAVGRGLAFGDLDNDGRIDLVVNNNNGPAMIIHNDHPVRHWIAFRLVGRRPLTDATGARVVLTAGGRQQSAYVKTAYSFASANDPRLHFGLGDAATVERVSITWPDGTTRTLDRPAVDTIHTIRQPGAQPLPCGR